VDRLIQRFQAAETRLGRGPQVGTAAAAVTVRAPSPSVLPAEPSAVPLLPPGGLH
jgi:NADH-quinone oxidoreductase subunit M